MTPEKLREIYGDPSERAARKEIDYLDHHCRAIIAASPFLILATSDGTNLDVSPKGDPAGFVKVVDDHHIEIPDRPGNNRIDGLLNILQHPNVSLIFLIPTVRETLRIIGTAEITDAPEVLERHSLNGKLPITVTRIKIERAFSHCGKAPLRAKLWEPETWPSERPVASLYEIIKEHADMEVPQVNEDQLTEMYKETLY